VNFAIDDDVYVLAEVIDDFCDKRCAVSAIADAASRGQVGDRDRWTALCELGLPVLMAPEPKGIGAGLLDATLLAERIGAALLPEPAMATSVLVAAWHRYGGNPTVAADLTDGSRVATFHASDSVAFSSTAKINGRVTVPADELVDLVAVVAEPSALVLLETAGLRSAATPGGGDVLRPVGVVDVHTTAVAELTLPGGAAERLRRELTLLTLAELVGGMDAVVKRTVRFVTDRHQFGRSIGSFQSIKHRLADMYAATEQARAALQFAAIDTAADEECAGPEVASVARWVPTAAIETCEAAVHLHGAMGYSWEVPVHLYLRRALAVRARADGSAP
jgi:alkylation response protein AidB-like acyl-CoA dehydrogenase